MQIRPSAERGHANHGWLDSRHSFSFASYHDPQHMGFGRLRVINQDQVLPSKGFGTHPHRDMEILSYVISGALEHRDTLGTGGVIRRGEIQLMSAGSGISHSEFNHSATEPVEFLQIWLLPTTRGGEPSYQQQDLGLQPGLRLMVSPDGRLDSLRIGSDVEVWRALLSEGEQSQLPMRRGRAWVQVIAGPLKVNGQVLQSGDGLALDDIYALDLHALATAEALIFDLE